MKITIRGDVHGHGFRFSAAYFANSLGIRGYVEYEDFHTLTIVVQGDEDSLLQFTEKIKTWNQFPVIRELCNQENELIHFEDFAIKESKIINHHNSSSIKYPFGNYKIYRYLCSFFRNSK